jgi:hypothetical protein
MDQGKGFGHKQQEEERKKRMKRERREEIRDAWVIAWLGINLQKTFLHH